MARLVVLLTLTLLHSAVEASEYVLTLQNEIPKGKPRSLKAHCVSSYGLNWTSDESLLYWREWLPKPRKNRPSSAAILCHVRWEDEKLEALFWAWNYLHFDFPYAMISAMHWKISAHGFNVNGQLAFDWTTAGAQPPHVEIWNDMKGEEALELHCERVGDRQSLTFSGLDVMPAEAWRYKVEDEEHTITCHVQWTSRFHSLIVWNLSSKSKLKLLPRQCLWRVTEHGLSLNGDAPLQWFA